jgi:DNA modification methylase
MGKERLLLAKTASTDYYRLKRQHEAKIGRYVTTEEFNGIYEPGGEYDTGTSIFDPVLCELAYRWFCTEGGTVLDPFAGGSVRGIVAAVLGYNYIGVELRPEQVQANRDNAAEVLGERENYPVWHCGDSIGIDGICRGVQADFVFSCPPYADLEVYSDLPGDISNMDYPEFMAAYREIIQKAVGLLKENRFACFVVGDVRDRKGFYRGFVPDTIRAFEDAGARFYNEIILVNVAGSLPIRAGRQFNGGRKVGKMHQNVLVFYKGDPKQIGANYPELDLSEIIENDGVEELRK